MNYKLKVRDFTITQLPKNVLRKKSKDIPIPLTPEDIELAEAMIYHIDDSQLPETKYQPGIGVAAVQYGVLKNMFYINFGTADPELLENGQKPVKDVFINPKIIAKSDFQVALAEGEGCLSVGQNITGQEGYVFRANRIVFEAYSYNEKKVVRVDLTGYLAIVAQHELDHLDGKLFIDHIDTKNPWKMKPNSRLIN
ncbi:formylmethionine deformylase [Mycoplasmopsis californica HAZ160_1]|uniref:Peptide deformylase n=2 Tax=Mycoplasmopsis californica TaxID=2113 RepID=A0A059XMQ5_9BACT|nr:peptide deformylase [Mycoplasmopsis californica]AIA29779.1 formylmethionyl-tRNA deformylase [Mycoplasmopsis californica]BAP00793.1 formylmethionine deformylase [Mycoplasmopsis californica HAZ160_1]BBG40646.1 formylmethionine deformylase [Mycoplasmopsis californica]BBG41241.1 formylmethionine deformylase [Mycoplasmopsis californica]BBG41834.1 formylmethionine deformylase [Mycoplasmopsis californica]